MKNIQRPIALLLALCMMLLLAPTPVGATGAASVSATSATANPGSYAYIYIDAAELSDLASLDLEIYYDSDALSVYSATNGSLLSGAVASVNTGTAGVIRLSAAWASAVSGTGRLLTVRFQINSDCAPGDYTISVTAGEAYDVSLNPVQISCTSGSITVNETQESLGQFKPYLSISGGTAYQLGDTVKLTMCNGNNLSFASGDFTLEYDSSLFRVESAAFRDAYANEDAVYSINTSIQGLVKVSYASSRSVSDYYMLDLVLTVIADTDTTTTVASTASDVYTEDLVAYQNGSYNRTLTLTSLPVVVDHPDLSLDTTQAKVGEECESILQLEAGAAVSAADFTVTYDPEVFACLSVTAAEAVSEHGGMVVINPNYTDGTIKFSYINESGWDEGLDLIEIRWEALCAPEIHYELVPGGTGVVDASYNTVELEYVTGSGCIYAPYEIPSTCTVKGETGFACAACGDSWVETTLELAEHSYSQAVTAPTCTNQGFTTFTCTVCGDSYADDYTDPLGHSYNAVITAPVCTEQGFTTHTCTVCGDSYVDDYTDALGHSYASVITAPTCTEQGFTTHACTRCSDSYVDTYTDPLGHNYETTVQEPTCTESGYLIHTCTACGDSFSDVYADPLGHTVEDGICIVCDTPVGMVDGTCGEGVYWSLSESGRLTIYGSGAMANYSGSNMPWYDYIDQITTLVVREGVTTIGNSAFRRHTALVSVSLPDSLTAMGSHAFDNCTSLISITLPDGITAIPGYLFYSCDALTEVILPEGVTTIGSWALGSCRALKKISLPESLVMLDTYAFAYSALTHVTLPEGLTTISERAFTACNSLNSIAIPDSVTTIGTSALPSAVLVFCHEGSTARTYARENNLSCCIAPAGEALGHRYEDTVTSPTCTEQGYTTHTCARCADTYVDAYTDAQGHSFGDWYISEAPTCTTTGTQRRDCANCDVFETETVAPVSHTVQDGICTVCGIPCGAGSGTCGDALFWSLGENGTLTVYGSGAMADYTSTTMPWYDHISQITALVVREGVTTIGSNAFSSHAALLSVSLPDSLTSLGRSAFSSCTALTSIAIPEGVTVLTSNLFYSCKSLTEIILPESLLTVESWALGSCRALKEITLPQSLVTLGNYSFAYSGLNHISLPEAVTSIGNNAFTSCSSLKTIAIPDSVTAIGTSALPSAVLVFCHEGSAALTYAQENSLSCCTAPAGEALGHRHEVIVTEPTCTESGFSTYICAWCSDTYVDSYIDALGHDLGDWYATVNATCTEEGEERRDCSLCDHYETRAVTAIGHSYEAVVTAPTCTGQGYTTHTCASCGDSFVDSYTDSLGHNFGDWYATVNATCTKDGEERRDCSRCDHFETRIAAAIEHSYEAVVTAPTCTEQGCTTHTCANCGNSYVDDHIEALGHEYVDGFCSRCGAADPSYITEIASGWSGATQWTLTDDGVLRFYGSGNMKNYGYSIERPWDSYAGQIRSVVIEKGVTAVGSGAFRSLTNLESVTLPDSGLTKIGEAAFYGCTALKEIYIPDGIYTIWSYTFKNCSVLTEVRLPKTLIKIDQGAFENCTALPYVFIPTNVQIIGSWSFKGCTGLAEADMQWADATEVREGAFKNCSALTKIILPVGIQKLGDSCFYGIGATSFTVPATVTAVEAWCFARAYSLTQITFEGDAPTIGEGAFNKITLTAYYPADYATWTSDIMQNYGGTVTWTAK